MITSWLIIVFLDFFFFFWIFFWIFFFFFVFFFYEKNKVAFWRVKELENHRVASVESVCCSLFVCVLFLFC